MGACSHRRQMSDEGARVCGHIAVNVGDAPVSAVRLARTKRSGSPGQRSVTRQPPAGRRETFRVAAPVCRATGPAAARRRCVGDGRFKSSVIQTRVDSPELFAPSRRHEQEAAASIALHVRGPGREGASRLDPCRTPDNRPWRTRRTAHLHAERPQRTASTESCRPYDMHRGFGARSSRVVC